MRILLFISLLSFSLHAQVLRKRTVTLMGGRFDFTIVDTDSLSAEKNIDLCIAEISRIEYLISDWKPETQLSEVNRNAGIQPIKVDPEVFELTKRAIALSELTDGAFDITFAAMDRIWKFDGSMTEMPSAKAIAKSVKKVGYRNIVLDSVNQTIFLKLPGMKIGFGALGEGYAVDRCKVLMLSKGVKAGIVNASGDLITWGTQPDGKPWKIGVNNPFSDKVVASVELEGAATTSGSYEKFVEFDGKRYNHIINPKTGYPASGITSVSVLGPSAEKANGFSTSIMVLGTAAGIKLMKEYPEYKYVMILDNGKVITSRKFKRKR